MTTGVAGIRLDGLVKTFASPTGPVRAVQGIDLEIAPGETVALLGPNGAGKSTLIDMLLGLLPPDAGSVSLFGRTPDEAMRAGTVGAMLQSGGLIKALSVRELVSMMASLYPDPLPVEEVLEQTGASSFAAQRTEKLSGGQTQRVRFAIALVSNPDLLVLDEPTVALDVEARHAFWTTMREIAATGRTVLFATHYLEEADAYADRIVVLAAGRIVADGAPTEIKSRVGTRVIRATLPGAEIDALEALPGVSSVESRGSSVVLRCSDSDRAIRALLEAFREAHDIEISGAGLEQAFLELTAHDDPREAMLSSLTYIRFELLRTVRNKRFFTFSLGFPLVLYFLIAGPNRNEHDLASSGLSAPLYYMVGLASFGAMVAALSSGARIASERELGWNRQLRLTPLSVRAYFSAKIVTAYASAIAAIVLLYAAGTILGVRLSADSWLSMTALVLVALIPFAGLGILGGHLLSSDSVGPGIGGSTAIFAFLGGTWFPIDGHGTLHAIAQCLPSFWLVQASHVALGGSAWSSRGWIVIAIWSVAAALLAGWAYRRDTARV